MPISPNKNQKTLVEPFPHTHTQILRHQMRSSHFLEELDFRPPIELLRKTNAKSVVIKFSQHKRVNCPINLPAGGAIVVHALSGISDDALNLPIAYEKVKVENTGNESVNNTMDTGVVNAIPVVGNTNSSRTTGPAETMTRATQNPLATSAPDTVNVRTVKTTIYRPTKREEENFIAKLCFFYAPQSHISFSESQVLEHIHKSMKNSTHFVEQRDFQTLSLQSTTNQFLQRLQVNVLHHHRLSQSQQVHLLYLPYETADNEKSAEIANHL